MTQDQNLLNGSVSQKLIQFAFPLFLANLLQALYNVVDMLVVEPCSMGTAGAA